jgi:hypothetical protein
MRNAKCSYKMHSLALASLGAFLWVAVPAGAQSTPMPQDHDTTVRELASFDSFMDSHPEIAEQLHKNPSLVENKEFVENHPALQTYLQQHPSVREEVSENPNAFMHREQRFDQRETNRELTNLDQFMDRHPEIAEQLRKNPSLVNDKEFVQKHPALQEFLQQHGAAAQDMRQNPSAFMQQEQRFDQSEQRQDRDVNRGELGSMDRFLDSHPEIAEQLRKNPSLLTNKKFVDDHPALQSYMQQHPQVRQEIGENPSAFMQREQQFDQREDSRDRDMTRGELGSMDRFLDSHPEIAEQLRKNPSLLTNKEFAQDHPALRSYLQQHPQVRQEIGENPGAFMQQEQRFDRQENMQNNGGRFDQEGQSGEMAGFGQFLGSHETIAQQISKNPSLLNNKEYMETHPELQAYLQAHPGVQEELKENPQAFMQPAQQVNKPVPKPDALAKPPQPQR